mmetsp:Transcript_129592/g.415534  ORF Transcript_129592/g.415534 Transcript_129592/m.415534 type:complete len:207 (-) Transcript_129592:1881-2501(-)
MSLRVGGRLGAEGEERQHQLGGRVHEAAASVLRLAQEDENAEQGGKVRALVPGDLRDAVVVPDRQHRLREREARNVELRSAHDAAHGWQCRRDQLHLVLARTPRNPQGAGSRLRRRRLEALRLIRGPRRARRRRLRHRQRHGRGARHLPLLEALPALHLPGLHEAAAAGGDECAALPPEGGRCAGLSCGARLLIRGGWDCVVREYG